MTAPAMTRTSGSDYSTLMKSIQALGLLGRRRRYYLVRIASLVTGLGGAWVLFGWLGDSWAQLGVAALLGVLFTQVLFLSHDAAHRQIFGSGRANEWAALLLGSGLGGVSLAWWQSKHTKHHAAPNQLGKDPDIDPAVVHFFPTEKTWRSPAALALHRRQGWWFFPILLVEALNLHQQSVVHALTAPRVKRRGLEIALLFTRLAVVPTLAFVFLSPGLAALFTVVQWAVTGVYLGSVFAVSHIGMPIIPADARIDFLRRQILTSRNIKGGRLATFLMGGLNYQIEHHLFPSMPRPNLHKARTLVMTFALNNDISYQEVSVHRAWGIVVNYLNEVGLAGRRAYSCPTATALR